MLRSLTLVNLLAFSVAASVSARTPMTAIGWPAATQWTPIFSGIDEAAVVLSEPRPLRVHALRVDLTAPGVSLVTDDDNGPLPEEVNGLKTSTFLLNKRCQAAINGAPFWPGHKDEGLPQNVVGLVVSDGELVSPVDSGEKARAAFVMRANGRADIERPPIDLAGMQTAVGGYGVVLEDGSVTRPAKESDDIVDGRHPRSAIGVANDGKTLLLVAVDGRQPGYSEGVDLAELGEILHRLGAAHGLNLDGGGTTTLVAADGESGFRLVNQPIDGNTPGNERISASHLGVYASPLPESGDEEK
ncbi:MAG: phosphodiester glycosidase family protein [Planctomycetota bacterium]